ncbi:hypothetical protein Tco_1572839 [Tanacetum coccineum]
MQEAQLVGIDHSFQMFVQGFNANFRTMANAVAHAMTYENTRQKAANEKLKDVVVELVKLKISSGDVLMQVSARVTYCMFNSLNGTVNLFVLEYGTSSRTYNGRTSHFGETCSLND